MAQKKYMDSLLQKSIKLIDVSFFLYKIDYGEMAEWSKATVLKTVEPEMVPWVRIPLSPPNNTLTKKNRVVRFF